MEATGFNEFCPNDSVDMTYLKWLSKLSRYNGVGQSERRMFQEKKISDLCDIMGENGFLRDHKSDDE